jgi:hypothetical protein
MVAPNHLLQTDPFDSLRSLRAAELGRYALDNNECLI